LPRSFNLDLHDEARGKLVVINEFPFAVKREFKIFDVPRDRRRGQHAHKECHQVLVAVTGTVIVTTDDGNNRLKYRLTSPVIALHVEPMVWVEVEFMPGAILQVFASHQYDTDDIISDYNQFLEEKSFIESLRLH
jgi:UDP-2-acetamido-3-amino-2,3-dideoxy-glucuronate N-acetyltransferase